MIVMNANDAKEQKMGTYPYKGKPRPLKDVYIRWLSQVGPDSSVEYGLRYFRIGPGGEIPIHNHLYYQTMFILSGHVRCFQYDAKTDQVVGEKVLGPNDFVFVPTLEVHSMRNESDQEPVIFLCCIANVYEEETM
jgi:quercetin dioxygenase-like cupin family protein